MLQFAVLPPKKHILTEVYSFLPHVLYPCSWNKSKHKGIGLASLLLMEWSSCQISLDECHMVVILYLLHEDYCALSRTRWEQSTKTLGVTKHNYKGDYLLWQCLTVCEKNATDLPPTAYQMANSPPLLYPRSQIGELQFWLLQSTPRTYVFHVDFRFGTPAPHPKNKIFSWGTLWELQLYTRVRSINANRGQIFAQNWFRKKYSLALQLYTRQLLIHF